MGRRERLRQERKKEMLRQEEVARQSRRRFLRIGLGTAAAVGLGSFGYSIFPDIAKNRRTYNLRMIFLDHNSIQDAARLLRHIDEEKAKGRPVGVLFIENRVISSNYDSFAVRQNKVLSAIHQIYSNLLRSGTNPQKALKEAGSYLDLNLKNQIGSMSSRNSGLGFLGFLYLGAAIRGLKIMPAEAYPKIEYDLITADSAAYNKSIAEFVDNVRSATLGRLMELEKERENIALRVKRARDMNVENNIKERLEDAVRIFPELGNGTAVNAVLCMGFEHELIYETMKRRRLGNLAVSMELYPLKYEIFPTGVHNFYRPFTTREAYLVAIEELGFAYEMKRLSASRPDMVGVAVRHALSMTEAQLQQLDRNSSRVQNYSERFRLIMRTAMGTEAFHALSDIPKPA